MIALNKSGRKFRKFKVFGVALAFPPDEIADAVMRLATDESLYGRILVWWSEDAPSFIPFGDREYATLVDEG